MAILIQVDPTHIGVGAEPSEMSLQVKKALGPSRDMSQGSEEAQHAAPSRPGRHNWYFHRRQEGTRPTETHTEVVTEALPTGLITKTWKQARSHRRGKARAVHVPVRDCYSQLKCEPCARPCGWPLTARETRQPTRREKPAAWPHLRDLLEPAKVSDRGPTQMEKTWGFINEGSRQTGWRWVSAESLRKRAGAFHLHGWGHLCKRGGGLSATTTLWQHRPERKFDIETLHGTSYTCTLFGCLPPAGNVGEREVDGGHSWGSGDKGLL